MIVRVTLLTSLQIENISELARNASSVIVFLTGLLLNKHGVDLSV